MIHSYCRLISVNYSCAVWRAVWILHNSFRSADAYVLMNWVIISSGNGLAPVRCQAITWTNADVLDPQEWTSVAFESKHIFYWKTVIVNVVCYKRPCLLLPQCNKSDVMVMIALDLMRLWLYGSITWLRGSANIWDQREIMLWWALSLPRDVNWHFRKWCLMIKKQKIKQIWIH